MFCHNIHLTRNTTNDLGFRLYLFHISYTSYIIMIYDDILYDKIVLSIQKRNNPVFGISLQILLLLSLSLLFGCQICIIYESSHHVPNSS